MGFLLGLITIIIIVVFVVSFVMGICKFVDYLDKIEGRKVEYEGRNRLYACLNCRRYFREWQSDLYRAKNDLSKYDTSCPHCGSTVNRSEHHHDNPLFDKHRDCPKISSIQTWRLKSRIDKIRKINRTIKYIDELRIYEERRKAGEGDSDE